MYLFQFSTQRHGRWLAALLLLPVQQASSLSDQVFKDADYPVLPLFGPLLTVRIFELACIHATPQMTEVSDCDAVCRPLTPFANAR